MYFIAAILITIVQAWAAFRDTKIHVSQLMSDHELTVEEGLANAAWNLELSWTVYSKVLYRKTLLRMLCSTMIEGILLDKVKPSSKCQ